MEAKANSAAIAILAISGQCGTNRVVATMPSIAPCIVPAVEGSTKRLCTTICITSPATDMLAPTSIRASVRGRRLTQKVAASMSSTPTNRLSSDNPARIAAASQARPERSGGNFKLFLLCWR